MQIPLETKNTMEGFLRAIKDIKQILLGRITFGDNIQSYGPLEVTVADADTDIGIAHSLGRIPTGFFAYGEDVATIIYASSIPWTASQITLKSSVGPATFKVTIF